MLLLSLCRRRAVVPVCAGVLAALLSLAGCGGGGDEPAAMSGAAGTSAATGASGGAAWPETSGGGGAGSSGAQIETDGSIAGPGSPRYGIDACECSAVPGAAS